LKIIETTPDCKYFNICGGCSLQHIENHGEYKFSLAQEALKQISFDGTLHPIQQVSQRSRRRVNFTVEHNRLKFHQYHSKELVTIDECLLLEDPLNLLIKPINKLLTKLKNIEKVTLTNSDTGIEIIFSAKIRNSLEQDLVITEFSQANNIARIAWQTGRNLPYALLEFKSVQLILDQTRVDLPINSFLQVSKESNALIVDVILKHLDKAKQIIELFCGCGSFTIPMATKGKIFAVEGNAAAVEALTKAAQSNNLPIKTMVQDLYHRAVESHVINDYSQVVINPPRNGATPQIKQIAQAKKVKKVILVSCSLENLIRDAQILLNAGFKLTDIYPIDQFLYSPHLELIGIFKK